MSPAHAKGAEYVEAAPFRRWVERELAVLQADADGADMDLERRRMSPSERFLTSIGWPATASAERKLRRWRLEIDLLPWLDVYDALTFAGAPWWDLYPEQNQRGRVDRGRSYVCEESTLVEAHTMHLDGMSLRACARELFDDCYSSTPKALAQAFSTTFRARGWEVRPQGEATALANRQRAWRPQCSHVHQLGEKRGHRCERRCVSSDTWCYRHNPGRMADGIARARAGAVAA